jgi:hypothetical protein
MNFSGLPGVQFNPPSLLTASYLANPKINFACELNFCGAGCPITPDASGFTITGGESDARFTCPTPVPTGASCSFTCGTNGGEPVEGTAPVCIAFGWSFAWKRGPRGAPACAPAPSELMSQCVGFSRLASCNLQPG